MAVTISGPKDRSLNIRVYEVKVQLASMQQKAVFSIPCYSSKDFSTCNTHLISLTVGTTLIKRAEFDHKIQYSGILISAESNLQTSHRQCKIMSNTNYSAAYICISE